jgi:hypothetical protein
MHRTPPAAEPALSVETDADGSRWLRCGERFDVLRVPEPAGRWALRRLLGYGQPALMPGPVALDEPGDGADGGSGDGAAACLFLVAPGATEDLPELLEWLDWGGIDLGLRAYGPGERVPEPRVWLHDPQAAPPEVIALLATIAECCSRRLLSRSVPGPRAQAAAVSPGPPYPPADRHPRSCGPGVDRVPFPVRVPPPSPGAAPAERE